MPNTPREHWDWTIKEWGSNFNKILDAIPEVSVVYDIGANVGGFTHIMKNKFPDALYFCFEPVDVNYQALLEYVPYAKSFKKGIYYGAKTSRALWRGSNIGAFFLEQVNSGEPRVDYGETISLCTLEELKLPKPDLIKIDIEGAEENVLVNSSICKDCPNLIIEWHPDHVDFREFFKTNLPKHDIVVNLDNHQFLLCKSQS